MTAQAELLTPLRDCPPTVEEIKDALRACKTAPDVDRTAQHYGPAVKVLDNSPDRTDRTMAIQIRNLAAYRRKLIWNGSGQL